PSVMSARTMPSERDRKMTIMLTPFMSCSAKLPIYAFFCDAFFPSYKALAMISLYVLGIIVSVIVALIFKKTIFKGEAVPFVMELPNYRLPSPKNVMQLLWEKAKDFLQRAFTVIFLATIVIWFLENFSFSLKMVSDPEMSILANVAGIVAPAFKPLGYGNWQTVTALISGFLAKESVVSTLSILYGSVGAMQMVLTPVSAVSLLVFCLLYTPCVAAIASIRRELGSRWATGVVLLQCAIAWVVSFIVYNIALLLF
ncbi:MAG: ferrous iron transporter B, partial [Erysipelotrichaceae bacterium]|nr:ferrous iron transporter B [Erysipelotrichaceae bacterium]